MNIYDYEEELRRKPYTRFTDRQLDLIGDLNASGYTFEVLSDFCNSDSSTLSTAYARYRERTYNTVRLSRDEISVCGVGPWYAQSRHFTGNPVDDMGRL
jgi:hypothetical protein